MADSELVNPLLEDAEAGGSVNAAAPAKPERNAVAVGCAFAAAVGAVVFGYSLGYSSPALPGMEASIFRRDVSCGKDNAVTSATASLFSSIVNVGCMIGALGGARILESVGRRGALLRAAAPVYAASWAATAVSQTPAAIIAARVALGCGVGVASVAVPVYIAETAPPKLRGALGAVNQLSVTLGIFGVYLVGLLLAHETIDYDCGSKVDAAAPGGWRVLAWIGAALGGALFVVAAVLPESPTWLARRGRAADAARALETLRGGDADRAASELGEICAKFDAEKAAAARDGRVGVADVAKMLVPWRDGATDGSVRAPLRIALAVMVIHCVKNKIFMIRSTWSMVNGSERIDRSQTSRDLRSRDEHSVSRNEPKRPRFERDTGLGRYRRTTELSVVFVTGHPAVLRDQRGHLLLGVDPRVGGHGEPRPGRRRHHGDPGRRHGARAPPRVENDAELGRPTISSEPRIERARCLLVDRLGRRALLLGSLGGMACAAALMGLCFALGDAMPDFVSLVALVVYIAAFSIGLGPIPWLLMAEILPSRARGVASSLATVLNWTCSFAVTESFASVLAALTPAGTFFLFAAICVAGAAYVYARLPETKGVTLDEIEAFFAA